MINYRVYNASDFLIIRRKYIDYNLLMGEYLKLIERLL